MDALFDRKVPIKIIADNKEFETFYNMNTADGVVNSCCNITNENAALLVPIYELTEEDIDSLENGIIRLNKSCKNANGSFVIAPNGRYLSGVRSIRNYSDGILSEHIEDFLGEDFVKDSSEYEVYGLLRSAPSISNATKDAKIEAVNVCLFENLNRDIKKQESVTVDGELFTLNSKNLISIPNSYKINENRVNKIINKAESFLSKKDYNKNSITVDQIYSELLKEYLMAHKKAKAEYYEEKNASVIVNNNKLSMKPTLPHSESSLAKRYSRKSEDVAYKIIKLANLCNRYAHSTEKEYRETSSKFFELKYALIEAVIDISAKNPSIKIKRSYDEKKRSKTIIVEIPGYSMISLHVMNESDSLCHKINKLDKSEAEHVGTSSILIGGINENLLSALKAVKPEERKKAILKLDSKTFYKFAIRMGYTSEDISTPEEKTAFINYMLSDDYIDKKIQEEKAENER